MDLTAVFLAYPLLWLGMHLPLYRVGARNDYSYGVYIYAYPVQQLLLVWGVSRWGYWPYTLLAVAAVIPFAVASWWVIEKHALKLKHVGWPLSTKPEPRVAADPSNELALSPGHTGEVARDNVGLGR